MAASFVGATVANRVLATVDGTGSYPSGWADGDYLLALLTSDASTADVVTTVPTNWVLERGPDAGVDGRTWLYKKVAATGDDTAPRWVWGAHEDGQVHIVCLRGVDTTSPIEIVTFIDTASGTSHTSASTAVTGSSGILVSTAFVDAASISLPDPFTPPGTMTQASEGGEAGSGSYSTTAYETYAAAPGTITRTWTLNTTADTVMIYLAALNSAGGGAPTAVMPPTFNAIPFMR